VVQTENYHKSKKLPRRANIGVGSNLKQELHNCCFTVLGGNVKRCEISLKIRTKTHHHLFSTRKNIQAKAMEVFENLYGPMFASSENCFAQVLWS
jgi:hypothetical protein